MLAHLDALAARDQKGVPTFLGGGRASALLARGDAALGVPERVRDRLHALPARGGAGRAPSHLRVPDDDERADGLPDSNASMYDGATAVAEAALLAVRQTRRETIAVSRGVHPETRAVLRTYLDPIGVAIETVDLAEDLTTAEVEVGPHVAALIVQNPNHFGYLEAMPGLAAAAHAAGALFVAVVDPLTLAVAARSGQLRRRHRGRRRSDPRRPDAVRRPGVRLHGRDRAAAPPAAGTPGRADQGRRRPTCFRADVAGARAAHPARQGEVQHLLQPPADGAAGRRQPRRGRPAGAARHGGGERPAGAPDRRSDRRCGWRRRPARAVLQRVRAPHEGRRRRGPARAGRAWASAPGSPSGRSTGSARPSRWPRPSSPPMPTSTRSSPPSRRSASSSGAAKGCTRERRRSLPQPGLPGHLRAQAVPDGVPPGRR